MNLRQLGIFVPLLAVLLAMAGLLWNAQQERDHLHRQHHAQLDDLGSFMLQLSLEYQQVQRDLLAGQRPDSALLRPYRERARALLAEIIENSHNARDVDLAAHHQVDEGLQALSGQFDALQQLLDAGPAGHALRQGDMAFDAAVQARFDAMFSQVERIGDGVRRQLQSHLEDLQHKGYWLLSFAIVLVAAALGFMQFAFRRQLQDVREKRELRGRLDRSEENFRNLFELAPIPLWLEDFSALRTHVEELRATGCSDLRSYCKQHPELVRDCVAKLRIIDVNQAAVRMHGASDKQELLARVGETFTDDSYDAFRREVIDLMDGCTEVSYQAAVGRLYDTSTGEDRPSDLQTIISLRVMPGHEQTLDRVLVAITDISERMHAEQGLRDSELRLRQAQRVAGIGSWEVDLASGDLQWSDEVYRLLQIDRSEQPGYELFFSRVHPEDRVWVEEAYNIHLHEGEPYDIEHRLLLPGGHIRYVQEVCRTDLDAAGRPLRSLGTMQDVTDRVLAEQARADQAQKMEHVQRLESLGVLAGGIAHDFNNLLTAILGHAALARQQSAPLDGVQQSLLAIEETSKRAAELCRQMLAYSGKGKFVVQPVDLSELVREMARLLNVSIGKGIVMRDELAANLPPVEADLAQMQQVIMNLVINASEAIGERSGNIVIATGLMQVDEDYLRTVYVQEEGLKAGRYVYLEVSDTGCGMDEETRNRLFEPFFTTKFTGRGLGMSAILGIVRGHHGAIKVYTEPGKGTSFKVLFPAASGQARPLAAGGTTANPVGDGRCVLVVDDEESIRNVAALMLERAGFTCLLACDGVEACEELRKHAGKVDLVLLDMTMPRMDGEQAFTELRRIQPGVKVVLSSGYNQQTATQRFTGKGLAGFVQKPYAPDTLLGVIEVVLGSADSPAGDA